MATRDSGLPWRALIDNTKIGCGRASGACTWQGWKRSGCIGVRWACRGGVHQGHEDCWCYCCWCGFLNTRVIMLLHCPLHSAAPIWWGRREGLCPGVWCTYKQRLCVMIESVVEGERCGKHVGWLACYSPASDRTITAWGPPPLPDIDPQVVLLDSRRLIHRPTTFSRSTLHSVMLLKCVKCHLQGKAVATRFRWLGLRG